MQHDACFNQSEHTKITVVSKSDPPASPPPTHATPHGVMCSVVAPPRSLCYRSDFRINGGAAETLSSGGT